MRTKDNFLEGAKVTKDNQTFAPDEGGKSPQSVRRSDQASDRQQRKD